MTHIPGPWIDGKTADSIIAPAGRCVADIEEWYGGYVVAESIDPENKPLIKAAPDLLEACKVLVKTPLAGLFIHDSGAWMCSYCQASTMYASSDIQHRHDCPIQLGRDAIASVTDTNEEE